MDRGIRRKLVIVGDGAVGKTSLFVVFHRGIFPEVYVPTVFENTVLSVEFKHQPVELAFWDTSAQGDYEDRLRPLSYIDAHAFLICFSVDSPDSLENVEEKWIPELRHFVGYSAPIHLVGCKTDLRTNLHILAQLASVGQSVVTTTQGDEMAKRIEATSYLECSSKTGEGVRLLFLRVLESMDSRVVSRSNVKRSRRKAAKRTHCVVM